jgi:hypothetical protein
MSSKQQPADEGKENEDSESLQRKLLSASMRLGTVFSLTDNQPFCTTSVRTHNPCCTPCCSVRES